MRDVAEAIAISAFLAFLTAMIITEHPGWALAGLILLGFI